jgi:hypothetical protein
MRLTGSGTAFESFINYRWQWFAGQGAYCELTEAVKACRDSNELPVIDDRYATFIRETWNLLWPNIGSDVEKKMSASTSKAIFLTGCSGQGEQGLWSSLYLVHPKMTNSLGDCRLVVSGDYHVMGNAANANVVGALMGRDYEFMEKMPVKFSDPAFAHSQLSKKPLPAPPPPPARATKVGGTQSTRGAMLG